MKKSINDRCPLQVECERKKCDFIRKELECPYYSANAREGYYIEDQEEIRNRQFREHWEHDTVAFLESLKNNGDGKNSCSCQNCKQPDCICAGMQDAKGRADCDGDKNCSQSGCTYAVKHRAAPAVVNSEQASIMLIPVEQLYPHPDNPRKDLGDLSELADSIKANGILQNLTVVPRTVTGEITGETWQKGYTVVIGHRRHAAAKLAGLKEVPCVISDMSLQEQVRTMLMENMQRADLTVYEQAQGFQMMLDMGDSVEDIARKSGFSQSTVRRRVKLLELDQEKFKASVERGANLMDYIELDKITDLELKNSVLDAIGTNNFRSALMSAIETEKDRQFIADRIADIKDWATEITEVSYEKYKYIRNYGKWNWKKDSAVERPDDADTVNYYYRVGMGQIDIYTDKNPEQNTETEEEQRHREQKEKADRIYGELRAITQRHYELRKGFIAGFGQAKSHLSAICLLAISELIGDGVYCRDEIDAGLLSELLNLDIDDGTDYPTFKAIATAVAAERPEYALLVCAYASMDSWDNGYYNRYWNIEKQLYICSATENEELDRLYEFLTSLGYQMSDEEKALQAGTHELFAEE